MSVALPRIKPLSKTVVNKIAAGEIIIAPSNAIKELLENSIDANSTSINITISQGGLKNITISDNGSGINKDDLDILCERFTTSKLQSFDQLQNGSIITYGFRGEALASISQVSHLTVITKTKQDNVAWKAVYVDGLLNKGGAKAIAGKTGTTLIIDDLFYNVKSRLRALRNVNDEYGRIVDVVMKYGIHTNGVGFTIKKSGSSNNDLIIRSNQSTKDRIKIVYGSSVSNELMDVSLEANLDIGLVGCEGMITNSSYYNNKKRIQPVFFINGRLVSCDPLKRAIFQIYSTFLPKGHSPFIYLSLKINPVNVDVNVHPTKREVRFLFEDEIIEYIVMQIEEKLNSQDSSRKFLTQQILIPKRKLDDELIVDDQPPPQEASQPKKKLKSISSFKKPYEHKLVRTDFKQQTLSSKTLSGSIIKNSESSFYSTQTQPKTQSQLQQQQDINNVDDDDVDAETTITPSKSGDISTTTIIPREKVKVNLISINKLRTQVENYTSTSITKILSQHILVGIIDYNKRLAAIQSGLKIFMVDYGAVCNELFYQIGLSDFSNFGKIKLSSPINVRQVLSNIYNDDKIIKLAGKDIGNLKKIDEVLDLFHDMKEMFQEYFSIEFIQSQEGLQLAGLPLVIDGYLPSLSKLSLFLFRLGNRVNFEVEQECLGGILRQIALFYIPPSLPDGNDDDNDDDVDGELKKVVVDEKEKMKVILTDLLFPIIKKRCLGTQNLVRDIMELANLPGLYKVFERC